MDPKLIKNISAKIYRQFPEMAGVQPRTRKQQPPANQRPAASTYLLTYQIKVSLPTGKTLPRYVRVVVDDRGSILKVTTSRG
jgi:hypothetical protein